jgi:hypothetical protein
MPVSDFVLSLALAFHPQGDAKLPLALGADVLAQPQGGARLLATESVDKKHVEALTVSGVKCATGEHIKKATLTDRRAGAPNPTVEATTGGHIKKGGVAVAPVTALAPQKCASLEHQQKW